MSSDCIDCDERDGQIRKRGRPSVQPALIGKWIGRGEKVDLFLEPLDLEVIYLIDVLKKSQNEAAKSMRISQSSLSRFLKRARHRIGEAITKAELLHVVVKS